ncbi:MAG: T9SS type A sorting domain-containing protein [Aureispira sp.]|nr:T9SS type A sorting domain-containing protein [Aureispira sp.]
MQKKIFYILLCCILSNLCTAQTYIPFDFDNGLWQEEYHDMQYQRSEYNYFTDGDTVINSLTYHKLYTVGRGTITYGHTPPIPWSTFSAAAGFIREDNNKRIYYNGGNGIAEQLLYDFNIALGDTISIPPIDNMFDRAVVVAVDSILICSTLRRRYKLDIVAGGLLHDLYWTEGTGSTHGLIPRYYSFERGVLTTCYSDSTCIIPCLTIVSTNSIENQSSKLATIYPNPSSTTSTLQLNNSAVSTNISIINSLGQVVLTKTTNNQEETLDLSQWVAGIYYVRLEYNQQVEVHYLIKQ